MQMAHDLGAADETENDGVGQANREDIARQSCYRLTIRQKIQE
jgi:hypothetical protein